jgi:hypothetical protein
MSLTKHGLAGESMGLAKSVLAMSALGVFTKLLGIDLSKLEVLGVTFTPATSNLLPGFIGLALTYTYIAFCVARWEASTDVISDPEVFEKLKRDSDTQKAIRIFRSIGLPFSFLVYSMPYVFGAFSIALLFRDSLSVLHAILYAVI